MNSDLQNQLEEFGIIINSKKQLDDLIAMQEQKLDSIEQRVDLYACSTPNNVMIPSSANAQEGGLINLLDYITNEISKLMKDYRRESFILSILYLIDKDFLKAVMADESGEFNEEEYFASTKK